MLLLVLTTSFALHASHSPFKTFSRGPHSVTHEPSSSKYYPGVHLTVQFERSVEPICAVVFLSGHFWHVMLKMDL